MASNQDYKAIAAVAQKRRQAALPTEHLLPEERLQKLPQDLSTLAVDTSIYAHDEIQIINAGVEEILQKTQARIWTSFEVASAFVKSATIAQQLTNCLTETFFDEALNTAKKLDEHIEQTGKPVGPLHGLPISLKDNFITPPHPSSIGMAGYANSPTSSDQKTVLVGMLKALGAVLYCKTNVPVAMMMMETNNNIWGPTRNAVHSGCNAGGSSGGEAALIAMRGSPLGVGTDIGGSIRIPSAFNGLYGLKPSYSRYPQWGGRSGIPGNEFVLAVNGPISRSLSSLSAYSAAVLSANPAACPWDKDPKCIPLPWSTHPQLPRDGRPLRFAVVGPHDGLVSCHPPVERALKLTEQALRAAGHEVVDWPVEDTHPEIVKILLAAFFDYGGSPIMDLLQPHGEPVFGAMKPYQAAAELTSGQPASLTTTAIREANISRNTLAKKYLDRWQDARLDGLIMAASPWAAVREGFTNRGPTGQAYFGYTAVWSLLDLPVVTFPVTRADRALDAARGAGWKPSGDLDGKVQADYDADFYDGAPVALQCVGPRLQEERLLEMTGKVVEALERSGTVYK